jgi:hypothetical protein
LILSPESGVLYQLIKFDKEGETKEEKYGGIIYLCKNKNEMWA